MPKLCPNIRFPHQQDFFPIRSVTKSSTSRFSHENLVEKFKIFVQDFVPIRTALIVSKTGNNSVYCTRFQEEHIKSTCFYCARTYLLVCTRYAVLWFNIFCVFATKLCAPTTYRRLDANVLPTFTMLRPFVGLVRMDLFLGMVLSPYKNNE